MAEYDKYYKTEDLFGEPFPELIEFFRKYKPKGKLIDLGCGQGRDCIPLARLGYKVSGVDHSKVGIDQMITKSNNEGLHVVGLIQDIYSVDNYHDFDIVLLDSMFHFDKRDKQKERELIDKIAKQINANGLICFCIQDTGSKVKILKETINNTRLDFEVLKDSSLVYKYEDKESGHKSETKYCMYIVRKKSIAQQFNNDYRK